MRPTGDNGKQEQRDIKITKRWVVSQGEFGRASMEGGMQAHGLMLSSQLDKSLIR